MEERLISFETAKLAKEKGLSIGSFEHYVEYYFDYVYDDDPTHPESHKSGDIRHSHFYNKNNDGRTDSSQEQFGTYETPTQSLCQKWLREKHNINVFPTLTTMIPDYKGEDILYTYSICIEDDGTPCWMYDIEIVFDTYEDALEAGLVEALKLI